MKQELFNNKTKAEDYQRQPKQLGLYEASHEHDACGVGMLVNIQGGKSHELVESALKVLENMRHRGAEGADNKTGDGAGIMLQIPHEFILLQGIPVPEKGKYGTGLLFLPKDGKDQAVILSVIIEEIEKEGLTLMHLRNVPTCPEILGEAALANEPDIKQIFITGFTESETADRKLALAARSGAGVGAGVGVGEGVGAAVGVGEAVGDGDGVLSACPLPAKACPCRSSPSRFGGQHTLQAR